MSSVAPEVTLPLYAQAPILFSTDRSRDMKITAVRLYVLEAPEERTGIFLKLEPVPKLRRIQYRQTRVSNGQPARQNFIEVVTDEGLTSRCTTFMLPQQ